MSTENDKLLTPSGGRPDSAPAATPASDLKHTPGPWIMAERGIILAESRTERKAIGQFMGFASEQQHANEHPYNCRLIIAGPDLLAKLESAARGLRNLVEFGAILPNYRDEAIRQAESFEAVIDQARGIVKSNTSLNPEAE